MKVTAHKILLLACTCFALVSGLKAQFVYEYEIDSVKNITKITSRGHSIDYKSELRILFPTKLYISGNSNIGPYSSFDEFRFESTILMNFGNINNDNYWTIAPLSIATYRITFALFNPRTFDLLELGNKTIVSSNFLFALPALLDALLFSANSDKLSILSYPTIALAYLNSKYNANIYGNKFYFTLGVHTDLFFLRQFDELNFKIIGGLSYNNDDFILGATAELPIITTYFTSPVISYNINLKILITPIKADIASFLKINKLGL